MAKDRKVDEGFLAGLILGGVVGAGLALIMAGEDKEKIRENLKKRGKKILDNLEEVIKEGKDRVEDKVEEAKEEIGKQAIKKVEEVKSSVFPSRRFFTRKGRKLS